MSELLLTETGVEHLPDGSTAVNVGPIVRALKFVTEGRGDDRGTDEAGNALPDLMSLAFAVVEAIILGGRKADYFRQVMRDLEARDGSDRSSLALAKEARRVQRSAPATALEQAAEGLEELLGELKQGSLTEPAAADAARALEAFRAFGADRWLSASAQLLVALRSLGALRPGTDPVAAAIPTKKRRARPKSRKTATEALPPPAVAKKPAAKKRPLKKNAPKRPARQAKPKASRQPAAAGAKRRRR